MKPDTFRKLSALGLTNEQIAGVLEVIEEVTSPLVEKDEERRAKGLARWHKWKANNPTNVSKRLPTLANDSRGDARVEDNLLPKKITGQEENKNKSPEADKSAPAAVIGLPTVSEGDFPVSQAEVDGWAEAFPGVDVRQQLAAMRQWLIANPTRRKTKRGMRKFVVTWLDRRQNAAPPPAQRATAPPQPLKPRNAGEDARQELIRRGLYAPDRTPKLIDQSDGNAGFAGTDIARRIAIATSGGRPT